MNRYSKIKPLNENGTVNAVIEITEGDFNKYEYNEELDILELDRIMQTTMSYPANYGFIPNTKGDDCDALDVLVISSRPITPGVLVSARIIGMLEMEDEGGMDEKILCVPCKKVDALYKDVETYEQLPEILIEKITHFFENYKKLEKEKWVKVKNWKCKEEALKLIEKSLI